MTLTSVNIKPLKIGNVVVDPPLILAPMAGVTNYAFRVMCKRAGGVGLVNTEMFSAYAIKFKDPMTRSMIDWIEEERPVSAQVFGGDPETVAIGAREVQDYGADIVDINFGCPVPKVAKSGSGAVLLKDLGLAREIIAAAREAVTVPLTVKCRIGWDTSEIRAIELAQIAEEQGVDAVAVHGRYATQAYSGTANWDIIAEVKKSVGIPVVANGDIKTPEDAVRALEVTGCDALMIGRGALGNPWVFSRISEYLKTGEMLPEPTPLQKLDAAKAHALLLREIVGEDRAAREMRGHLIWYLKGLTGGPKLRARLMTTKSVEEIGEVLDEARSRC